MVLTSDMTRDEAQAIIDRLNTPTFGGRVQFNELNNAAQAEVLAALDVLGGEWKLVDR